eukprot:gene29074-32282_t
MRSGMVICDIYHVFANVDSARSQLRRAMWNIYHVLPLLTPPAVREDSRRATVDITMYCPVGSGPLVSEEGPMWTVPITCPLLTPSADGQEGHVDIYHSTAPCWTPPPKNSEEGHVDIDMRLPRLTPPAVSEEASVDSARASSEAGPMWSIYHGLPSGVTPPAVRFDFPSAHGRARRAMTAREGANVEHLPCTDHVELRPAEQDSEEAMWTFDHVQPMLDSGPQTARGQTGRRAMWDFTMYCHVDSARSSEEGHGTFTIVLPIVDYAAVMRRAMWTITMYCPVLDSAPAFSEEGHVDSYL